MIQREVMNRKAGECLDALETYIGELEALNEEHSDDESTMASTQAVVNIRGESPEEFVTVQVQSNNPALPSRSKNGRTTNASAASDSRTRRSMTSKQAR